MDKHNLRSRMKELSAALPAALLTLSLLLPLCPVSAAEAPITQTSESGQTATAVSVWSGEVAFGFPLGSGGRYDPYLITRPEELAYLAERVNSGEDFSGKYFKLTADLYLNDLSSYDSWKTTAPLHEWIPIGGYISLSIIDENAYNAALAEHGTLYLRTESGYEPADRYIKNAIYYHLASFNGSFNGNGFGIYGLYISSDQPCVGLFGACEDATLTALTLSYATISASDEAGALIGHLDARDAAEITNCHVDADITATGHMAGGLAGSFTAHSESAVLSVTDCSAKGKLYAKNLAGGLIGTARYTDSVGNLQIETCTSSVSINAQNAAGGMVGSLSLPATLLKLESSGTIAADSHIGGIVGEITSDTGYITVSECRNNASLVGQHSVGGIVGYCTAQPSDAVAPATDDTVGEVVIELLGCSNLGDLFGTEFAGGIIGSATTVSGSKFNLIGCKNSASVNGKSTVGGIAGELSSEGGLLTVGSCENYGAITCRSLAGGIAGSLISKDTLTLYQCVGYAAVTAADTYAGGIAGQIAVSDNGQLQLELSCSSGNVKAAAYAGGIVGRQYAESASSRCVVTNCFSNAQLTAEENAGGIAGAIETRSGQSVVNNCIFVGSFASGNKLTGGIAAYAHAETSDADVQIDQCYYLQSAASRPVLLYGGKGNELCRSANGLTEDSFKNVDQLIGLDFTSIWQPSDEENRYPTLRSIPFIWESFQYSVSGKSATLIAYLGKSDIVIIPSKLGGMPVTTIDDSAFQGCTMAEVVLPDSVTTIGEYAFADCQNLRTITLPATLRTVGAAAFKNCTALETRRSASALTDLYTGSENEAFTSLPIINPVSLQVRFLHEDGSTAAKSASITCYRGDYYLIEAPAINGYEADITTLAGICQSADQIDVLYRLGSYQLTVRYLYPDGSEAADSYTATYRFGEQYSITSPNVSGYLPANSIIEGLMEGNDVILTVYYSEQLVQSAPERPTNQSLLIILLIFVSFALICCIAYFIFRYRSSLQKEDADTDFDSLFTPRI